MPGIVKRYIGLSRSVRNEPGVKWSNNKVRNVGWKGLGVSRD